MFRRFVESFYGFAKQDRRIEVYVAISKMPPLQKMQELLLRTYRAEFTVRFFPFHSRVWPQKRFMPRLPWTIVFKPLGSDTAADMYRSLGASKLMRLRPGIIAWVKARVFANRFLSAAPTKSDLEKLSVAGVTVGDLLYDEYLRVGNVTVDFTDAHLRDLVSEAFFLVCFWKARLAGAKAVVAGAGVYFEGIPGRVAVALGVPAFSLSPHRIYRLSKETPQPEMEHRHYRTWFDDASAWQRAEFISQGRKFLESRLGGAIDSGISYLPNSQYSQHPKTDSYGQTDHLKTVLVALHDFYDSPHHLGVSLFPDFFEWLEWMAIFSKRHPQVDFLVKMHPNSDEKSHQIVRQLVEGQRNIKLLTSQSVLTEILGPGLSFATTAHGTIASELPALGYPVVNASPSNPHKDFDFSITPQSIEEYEQWLDNLIFGKHFEPNLDHLYAYHYFHNILRFEKSFLSGYREAVSGLISPQEEFSESFYTALNSVYIKNGWPNLQKLVGEFTASDDAWL